MKTILCRYAEGAVYALVYMLCLWGLFSLFGAPSFMSHHLWSVYTFCGVISMFSYVAGKS